MRSSYEDRSPLNAASILFRGPIAAHFAGAHLPYKEARFPRALSILSSKIDGARRSRNELSFKARFRSSRSVILFS